MRVIAVNERGNVPIGEDHPKALLTDHEVELVRVLHEQGETYERLAIMFEVSKWSVGRICRYERRVYPKVKFRKVIVETCNA